MAVKEATIRPVYVSMYFSIRNDKKQTIVLEVKM